MTYAQTIQYLYGMLPMFTRVGAAAYKKDLTNTLALCRALNNPQTQFKTIHVAGTNGKGSTSHMLASVLQNAGYKTGLYTSPHLKDFRERIKVNGKAVSKSFVSSFVERNKALIEQIKPSFFECTVAMAFDYFASKKVDVAIIETGLGGRLDSTNVITPDLSVITNIGWDHTDLLGDTLEKIATEKAGIIKQNIPVVVGSTLPETLKVFKQKSAQTNSKLLLAQKEIKVSNITTSAKGCSLMVKSKTTNYGKITCDLGGIYQKQNIALVVLACEQIKALKYQITKQHIKKGIATVVKTTGLMGRWQVLQKQPLTIADVAHNEDGMRMVVKQLKQLNANKIHFVIGMVKDKDIAKVLRLLPKNAQYYFTNANLPRALNAHELAQQGKLLGLKGGVYTTVKKAVASARKNAFKNDVIFIGGSTFVVAEAI